jgi:UDP-N-acetylglucosamine enolpyruvyl transferase
VQVSVQGTRTLTGTACTLLAIREAAGTWMIHSLHAGAVRLTEGEAARMATAILHLVSPGVVNPVGRRLSR